jgi:nicotinamide riboside transporter PnuC
LTKFSIIFISKTKRLLLETFFVYEFYSSSPITGFLLAGYIGTTCITLTLVQKLEISNLKLSLINSVSFIQKYYLHEVAAQEEDMECKRILLTAREKQNIVNYCLERGN